jgi:hypothetical protein
MNHEHLHAIWNVSKQLRIIPNYLCVRRVMRGFVAVNIYLELYVPCVSGDKIHILAIRFRVVNLL